MHTRQARSALERLLERRRRRLERARESYGFRRAADGVYEHQQAISALRGRAARALADQLRQRRRSWAVLCSAYGLRRPEDLLVRWGQRLAERERRLGRAVRQTLLGQRGRPAELTGRLQALSPKGVLARGYALARHADGRLVRRAGELAVGDPISVEFGVGSAGARVETLQLPPANGAPGGATRRASSEKESGHGETIADG